MPHYKEDLLGCSCCKKGIHTIDRALVIIGNDCRVCEECFVIMQLTFAACKGDKGIIGFVRVSEATAVKYASYLGKVLRQEPGEVTSTHTVH